MPVGERIAANNPVYHWTFPDPPLTMVGKVREAEGPPARIYPAFGDRNRAAVFGPGNYLRHGAAGSEAAFKFTNGDTITIEAWVRCDQISEGQIQYLIGKGRTHLPGFDQDNQNWALRLHAKEREARLSFLFRSQGENGKPGEYHRWTSQRGFAPGKRWHHLAVTYQFGTPTSMRGWLDGEPTDGSWDKGGPTAVAPVVDDDEVWIGSAQAGVPGSTFRGAISHLALYRHQVPGLEQAYEVRTSSRPPDFGAAAPDRVFVEIYQADAGAKEWPFFLDDPLRTLDASAFALFNLPPTYGDGGERMDQEGVYLVRLAARVTLPKGSSQFLLRAPGLAKLTIGNEEAAHLGPAQVVRDAHGPLRERLTLPYLRPRLGTNEVVVSFDAEGGLTPVVIEALVGDPGGKIQVGEIVAAISEQGSAPWTILSPGREIPFTPAAVASYRNQERAHHDRLNTALRRELLVGNTPSWEQRHQAARDYLASLPPVAVPPLIDEAQAPTAIDRFLLAKIQAARANEPPSDSRFLHEVHPLLEEHCFRCHGKKQKGGLRLDSHAGIFKGGESGPALVSGDPGRSELYLRITSEDPDLRMPPKGERLTVDERSSLEKWIVEGAPWDEPALQVTVPGNLDELSFLRRLYLDTVGVFPTPDEIRSYRDDPDARKREILIERLLQDPRHADHWVSYWQDVLAENPRLVKPMLNNTGPFRWWIHEALLDNKPFDRFVTELVTFAGGAYSGGAGGFRLATQNDVPMAAKAHVLGTAFLGLEMKCARCHDAPFHSLGQKELFSFAAMLRNAPLKVPATSTVPREFFERIGERPSRIKVTLDPNTPVAPVWPFAELAPVREGDPAFSSSTEQLAYQITRPENRRFARVIVNRVWKRYFGQGFVEPAHDWEGSEASHPELLDYLARQFVSHDYDVHHLSRLVLNSAAYRRAPRLAPAPSPGSRFFEAPLRRRLSAEQLVDSLFAATGTPLFAEELTLDVQGWYPNKNFLNMGRPRRAWQFVSLSTERDRPSLTLPLAQSIVSFMEAYGWRSNRAEPMTDRVTDPDVLQAGMLANSLLGTWWTRLSDYSELTKLAVEAKTPEELIDQLYLRLLTRAPSPEERRAFLDLLAPEFDSRLASRDRTFTKQTYVPGVRDISWRNHLNAEANQLAAQLEEQAQLGPPPSDALTPGWREALEDAIWSLINSPEMQFTP